MARYIDADAAVDAVKRSEALVRAFGFHNAIEAIREVPAADVTPVRRGEWVYKPAYKGASFGVYICSCCEAPFWWNNMNYCPNCGAKMDGGEDDER